MVSLNLGPHLTARPEPHSTNLMASLLGNRRRLGDAAWRSPPALMFEESDSQRRWQGPYRVQK